VGHGTGADGAGRIGAGDAGLDAVRDPVGRAGFGDGELRGLRRRATDQVEERDSAQVAGYDRDAARPSGSAGKTIRLWDVGTRICVKPLRHPDVCGA
jgi:hypothetical protein